MASVISSAVQYTRFLAELEPGEDPFASPHAVLPRLLVGRDQDVADIDTLFARLTSERFAMGRVFRGPRGSGKSVMLRLIQEEAKRRGWIVVSLSATTIVPFRELVLDGIESAITRARGRRDVRLRVRRSGVRIAAKGRVPATSAEVELQAGPWSDPTLTAAFERILGVALDQAVPVVLLIDEADCLTPEDGELLWASALGPAASQDLPISLVGATGARAGIRGLEGTSTFPAHLMERRTLARLTAKQGQLLLHNTAALVGLDWSTVDMHRLVAASLGNPRFLQVSGSRVFGYTMEGVGLSRAVAKATTALQVELRELVGSLEPTQREALTVIRRAAAHDGVDNQEAAKLLADIGFSRVESIEVVDVLESHGYLLQDEETIQYVHGSMGDDILK